MSFQAYLDNIQAKTGVTPEQFLKLAKDKGFAEPGVKATPIVNWLKDEYQLGHGHAMAIVKHIRDNQK
jgi:hypothetical protein